MKERSVQVFVDGTPVVVPARVVCRHAARGALGVARGCGVAYQSAPREPLAFTRGHEFQVGERYVTLDALATIRGLGLGTDESNSPRAPWESDPDAWRGGSRPPPI